MPSPTPRRRLQQVALTLGVLALTHAAPVVAQNVLSAPPAQRASPDQTVLELSRMKWRWMADRNVDSLGALFHDEAVFVHMGGAWGTKQELDIIRSGGIHYKHAEIFESSVRFIGTTAIVLNRIRLDAVVGGNEVSNPFIVTEVYVRLNDTWRLGSLSFTRLLQ